MIVRNKEGWTWEELSPATKVVVAAFSGQSGMIGDAPGMLTPEEFNQAYQVAFPHKKQINFGVKPSEDSEPFYSLRAIRNSIVNSLDRERTARVTEEMAQLAGGDYMAEDMAGVAQSGLYSERPLIAQAQEAVRRIDVRTAFQALEGLGQLALTRMAPPPES
jgi:hypothetical protein